MSMNVTIEITGLALCFKKSTASEWTVSFACDGAHDLNFKHDLMPASQSLHTAGKDLFIKLGDGQQNVFQPAIPTSGNTGTIFNMNADYAHDGHLVEQRRKTNVDEVRMFVPNSQLSGADDSVNDYFSQRQDFPGAPVVNVGKIATKLTLKFTALAQFDLARFEMMGGAPHGNAITIPYVDGGRRTLYFENHCGTGCSHNDSLDLYEIFADDTRRLQFAWGQIKPRTSMTAPYGGADLFSPDYGNCDPAWSDPPVGG